MTDSGAPAPGSGVAFVLDASAVLAVLYDEPGQEEIRERLRGTEALMSAVSFSEVVAKLAPGPLTEGAVEGAVTERRGFDADEIRKIVRALGIEVRAFDAGTALDAGLLREGTKDRGLSLGDRACVAQARRIGGVALTLDGGWRGLDGVEVIVR